MPQIASPKRGAIPSPRSVLAAAKPMTALLAAPPTFITIPNHISMWGNDVYGDCVTAEEAFAKACNNPEIFIPDGDVIDWAARHGVRDGAYLTQVMQFMQDDGFHEAEYTYDDGPYFSVDWSNPSTLQSAIADGPVKIGIAADQVQTAWNSTGGRTGWFGLGFQQDDNEDHCVSLCGYGSLSWLAQQLGVQVPAGVDGSRAGYALFTWNTIGIIDEPSLRAITHEAWIRQPTTMVKTQPFPPAAGNPALIQGRFGRQGNFELVSPAGAGGLDHFWRNNDDPAMPWSGATPFGGGLGPVDAVSMIESNYGNPGNLELVCRAGSELYFFWRDSGPAFQWNGPFALEGGVSGIPALIQSRFGRQGNFELVTPCAAGGLAHYWRNNDDPAVPWSGATPFGGGLGPVDAVSMIESNYGNPGNLELVCRAGSELYFFWRDSGPAFQWNGPFPLEGGASGSPALIQSRFGQQGNFELVTPCAAGGLAHYWRNNDDPAMPWSGATPFGGGLGQVDAVSMIESNYGSPGNLEVICRSGSQLYFFWRDSGPAFQWNGPFELVSTI